VRLKTTGRRALTGNGAEAPLQLSRPAAQPEMHAADPAANEELARQIWKELLGAIGLDLPGASRVQSPAVREQATAAWNALEHLAHNNYRLRAFLKEVEESRREALAQRFTELRNDVGGDTNGIAMLHEVSADLDLIFKALLLLPETGVVRELVEALEDAAQDADGQRAGEAELHALLRSVQSEIERIDKSRAEAWKHIVHLLETRKSDGQSPTIHDLDTVNKRPY
jgi:hypothetical protein